MEHNDIKLDQNVSEFSSHKKCPEFIQEDASSVKESFMLLNMERNRLHERLFETHSEFCAVETDRDLEKECARYFQEQVSSVNSSLLLKENEVLSLRERYKLLNDAFLNSESLREDLENEVSRMTEIIKDFEKRLEKSKRNSKEGDQNKQEQGKVTKECNKIEMKLMYLEKRNQSITDENKKVSSLLDETRKRLETVEMEFQTMKSENVVLKKRLKQQDSARDENCEDEKPSTQVGSLRKKLKEIRAKRSEERKRHEVQQFEIKYLKEKVEKFAKNEKEIELQLEDSRKKLLEVKTERDGLLMDLDSVNKRKKKDTERYTSKIETLEDELRVLKERDLKKTDGKQIKETVNILNEEKKFLDLKLSSMQERHLREVTELKTSLESLENRHTSETRRFERIEAANQNELLTLKKSLSAIELKYESQAREIEKLKERILVVDKEKEKIERILNERNSEITKWKKESLNDKAEIKFLRGCLNILEKEGLISKLSEIHDRGTT